MKTDAFYFEIKDLITQFIHAFDGIVIKRFNKQREIQDKVKVRYVYAPKQRVIYDIVNKAKTITLPVVAVNITSVARDNTRVFNKLDSSYYKQVSLTNTDGDLGSEDMIRQPVPVNIGINMSILTKYQSDMDQILSNFIPYTNPYIVISWKMPVEFVGIDQEIRSEVLWNDNININYPTELSPDIPYRISADTSFIIKGWLFRKHSSPVKTIFTIDTTFYPVTSVDNIENVTTLDNLNDIFDDKITSSLSVTLS